MFNIIRMGCECRHDPSFNFVRPNGLDGILMLFVRTRATFDINGERMITEPDTFVIFEKNSPLDYGAYEGEYINDWITFNGNEIPVPAELYGTPHYIGGKVDIARYFKLIGDCYFRGGSRQTQALLIKAMLNEVYTACHEDGHSIPHYRELLDLRGRIYAAPQEDWTIARMANLVCVSESYLYLLYKHAFGVTCNADVINSRMEQAKHYLAYSEMGIEEIAFMCGYKSPVHFSRQFKQINDSSPKEWRIMNNEQ